MADSIHRMLLGAIAYAHMWITCYAQDDYPSGLEYLARLPLLVEPEYATAR